MREWTAGVRPVSTAHGKAPCPSQPPSSGLTRGGLRAETWRGTERQAREAPGSPDGVGRGPRVGTAVWGRPGPTRRPGSGFPAPAAPSLSFFEATAGGSPVFQSPSEIFQIFPASALSTPMTTAFPLPSYLSPWPSKLGVFIILPPGADASVEGVTFLCPGRAAQLGLISTQSSVPTPPASQPACRPPPPCPMSGPPRLPAPSRGGLGALCLAPSPLCLHQGCLPKGRRLYPQAPVPGLQSL